MGIATKRVKIAGVVLGSVLILLVISLVLLFMLYFNISKTCGTEEKRLYRYQKYRLNPVTNETSLGIIGVHDDLLNGKDYLSFEDEEGCLNLISNFGDVEYECSGSCYCEEELDSDEYYNSYDEEDEQLHRRRSSVGTTAIRKGMKYLVVAVSSLVAYDLAKSRFDEECHVSEELHCPVGSTIVSEVDECNHIYEARKKKKKKKKRIQLASDTKKKQAAASTTDSAAESTLPPDNKKKKQKGVSTKKEEFICSGSCMMNPPTEHEGKLYSWGEKSFSLWTRIKLLGGFFTIRGKCKKLKLEGATVREKNLDSAIEKFIFGPLNTFCDKSSLKEFKLRDGSGVHTRSMCRGYVFVKDAKKKTANDKNPSVVCRKVGEEDDDGGEEVEEDISKEE